MPNVPAVGMEKCRRVEPVGNGLRMRIRINASDAIRSLVDEIAVPECGRPDVDGIGDACAQDSERRDPPPREQLTAKARTKEPMALTERHVMGRLTVKFCLTSPELLPFSAVM